MLLAGFPAVAGAYTTAPGYAAQDYATGFPASPTNHWGPLGVAFDQSDNLYVADAWDGNIYRFQPGGGVASAATRLTESAIPGQLTGLAISSSGAVYVARYRAGDVVQVDPGTGQVIRTVASVPCATGLAIDPATGDLFVSENQCGSTIYRVSRFGSGLATVSAYASSPGVDGLAFDSTGTLYAVSDGEIIRVGGTQSSSPGAITHVATVEQADGLAFGAPVTGQPAFMVVNRNDGVLTRIDLNGGSTAQTNIFSGGTRGDFVAVDSFGCLFVTQSTSVVRFSGAGGSCAFQPSTTGPTPPARVLATTVRRVCTLTRSLKFRLSQQGRVRLSTATIYVNGRRVRQVRGAAVTAPIVISQLPKSSFTLEVVAITSKGKRMVTKKFYTNCAKPASAVCVKTGSLLMRVPQPGAGRVVSVEVYVNGRRVRLVRGQSIMRVTLKGLPHGRFTVKLVTRSSSGKRATSSQTFTGCAATSSRKST
jgi:sugar lactone lactonase YvrE